MAKDADEQSRSSPVVVLELPPPPPPPLKKPSSPAAGWMPLPADEASTLSLGLAKAGHAAVRQSPTTATRNLVIMAAGRRQVSALCDDETLCAPSPWPFLIAQKKTKKPSSSSVWETSMPSKRKGEGKDALVVVTSLVYIVYIIFSVYSIFEKLQGLGPALPPELEERHFVFDTLAALLAWLRPGPRPAV